MATATLLVAASPRPAAAQALGCVEAAAKVLECAELYCPLLDDVEGCRTSLEGVVYQLRTGECTDEHVAAAQRASCSGMLSQTGTPVGAGNACERAAEHMWGCMVALCEDDPSNPMCATLDEVDDWREEMPECTDAVAEMAEEMLTKSCEELFGF